MKVMIISDRENSMISSAGLQSCAKKVFSQESTNAEVIEVCCKDAAPCVGCFGCWIKTPGECVIKDKVIDINKKNISSDVVIYLGEVVFGQYSSTMKNVIDRSLGKRLPFFKKLNGRTVHPERYNNQPIQYAIGCMQDEQTEEEKIFMEMHAKYRRDIKTTYICNKEEKLEGILNEILMEVKANEAN